jgi:hypothetical protein
MAGKRTGLSRLLSAVVVLAGLVERDLDRCAVPPEAPEVPDLAALASLTDEDATDPDGFGLRSGRLVSVRAVPDKDGGLETTDLAVGVFSGSAKPAPSSEVQSSVRRRLAGERARPCDGGGVAISPRLRRLLAIALQLGSGEAVPCNHCSIDQDAPNSSCEPERSSDSSCDCIVDVFCRSRAGLLIAAWRDEVVWLNWLGLAVHLVD